MDNDSAVKYLESLLNRTFRAHTSDGRMFLGEFKCTDNESNIILAKTYEYRMPTAKAKQDAIERQLAGEGSGKADMTSRFLGLVVVPGQHITKLEVEERKPWELPLRPN
ncbi:hypothetical protein GJ744_002474 [Endocarpon pusillum]|uniref:Sm domain-containing protein n=1 Tax=Endocarpon pusillum TaxID=364733 RepID=A0A8H7A7V8_9EURO|nr:hypothetical protein GJ744_002474 [Endocarpon pusillum]